jgi:hypothetical protein
MIHPEMAAAGRWTTASDLGRMVIAMIRSHAGEPGAFLDQTLAREMLTPVADRSALGVLVGPDGAFDHAGGTIGLSCLHLGNPRAGNGMVVMTNGNNGPELFDELHRRVAEAYAPR